MATCPFSAESNSSYCHGLGLSRSATFLALVSCLLYLQYHTRTDLALHITVSITAHSCFLLHCVLTETQFPPSQPPAESSSSHCLHLPVPPALPHPMLHPFMARFICPLRSRTVPGTSQKSLCSAPPHAAVTLNI